MFKTEQETFWKNKFGNDYINRNNTIELLKNKKNLFQKIFENIDPIKNIIEFGANIGLNLLAIKEINNDIKMSAVEINKASFEILKKNINGNMINDSILNYNSSDTYDFVFTMGVLIHLNPDVLDDVYNILYNSSNKYIFIGEYYNPTPVCIDYHGEKNKLFKRDFAGELMKKFNNLELIDYGFVYNKDPLYPLDDITWFLFIKK
jgi:pseudaminic acid biosynthesis-associated methylase